MFDNLENELHTYDQIPDKGKSSVIEAYLSLILLAFMSALVIASPALLLWLAKVGGSFASDYQGLTFLSSVYMTTIIQELLIIPATLVVVVIYQVLSRRGKLDRINLVAQIFIPFALNALTANLIFLYLFVVVPVSLWANELSASQISRNLIVTIEKESIRPNSAEYNDHMYHVTLHVENKNGQEVSGVRFYVGDYTTQTSDNWGQNLGRSSSPENIHQGSSDIIVDMPIYDDMDCGEEVLTKPLYLLYSFPVGRSYYGRIPIGNSINQRLQELACGTK